MKHIGMMMALALFTWALPGRAAGPPPTPAAPPEVSSVGVIAGANEPGQRLVITGTVYAPDGVTPAPGVIVYAYQTDAGGEYHNDAQRVARLHGWAKSDAQGHFEFRTIHPGAYPAAPSRRTSMCTFMAAAIRSSGPRTFALPEIRCSRRKMCSARRRKEISAACVPLRAMPQAWSTAASISAPARLPIIRWAKAPNCCGAELRIATQTKFDPPFPRTSIMSSSFNRAGKDPYLGTVGRR